MKFGERFDAPRQIEKLDRGEQVKRLHHELGVMYDRVFLTGNWDGYEPDRMLEDKSLAEDIKTNIFEDKVVDNPTVLVDGLRDFLRDIGPTVPEIMGHEDMMSGEGRDDFKRALFLKVIGLTLTILSRPVKNINQKELEDVLKTFDTNIHHFRDFSMSPDEKARDIGIKKGIRTGATISGDDMEKKFGQHIRSSDFDSESEDLQTTKGLSTIYKELMEIARSGSVEIL